MSEFILYNYFRSSTSYRVRIALNIKNIPYDYRPISLLKNGGEQNSPEYRAINPLGGVPSLVHNGNVISESMAIVEYLDEVAPLPKLFRGDAFMRAKIRQFCEIINSEVHPLNNMKVQKHLQNELHASDAQKMEWMTRWTHEAFSACEKILEKTAGTFCFGGEITAADLFLSPHVLTSQRFQIDVSKFYLIQQIHQNCQNHPAFAKAHPYRQPDTPDEFRIS